MGSLLSQKTVNESNAKQNAVCDKGSIDKCDHLDGLKQAMVLYETYYLHEKKDEDISDHIDISQALDSYIHLLYKHDNDNEFEFIVNQLPPCNIKQCHGFQRNYRDRSKYVQDAEKNDSMLEILDNIHCYFMHSYDIGYRLTSNERKMLENEIKVDIDDEINELINRTMLNMKNIVSKKSLKQTSNIRSMHKLDGLLSVNNNQKMFHFGHAFSYGHKGEYGGYGISISYKYSSLKEELISNNISVITIDQFDNEYKKAMINFNSIYCKQSFPNYEQYEDDKSDDEQKQLIKIWTFSVDFVLALMIYCNYTALQYEFSKTYRMNEEDATAQHPEFYHLGKTLKIAVHKFGTEIQNGTIQKFYHGMSEMLQFEKCVDLFNGINIQCPLSTTSSFAVAVNFATLNGMIIEFHGDLVENSVFTKYVSVDWLSDFSEEKEYLFIQNDTHKRLEIRSIQEIATGIQYDLILDAIKYINEIFMQSHQEFKGQEMQENVQVIIKSIIHHQLSLTNSTYKSFESLSIYGKGMVHLYFQRDYHSFHPTMDYNMMKKPNLEFLLNDFWYSDYEWIKLKNVVQLFPNAGRIDVKHIRLSKQMFIDILHNLSQHAVKSKLDTMYISCIPQDNAQSIVDEYKQLLNEIGYKLEFRKCRQQYLDNIDNDEVVYQCIRDQCYIRKL